MYNWFCHFFAVCNPFLVFLILILLKNVAFSLDFDFYTSYTCC